jgi:predicted DNA-binding protein with PD1-like motif
VLDKGDEAVGSIENFARKNGIAAAQLTGIGAFSDAVLGFFDWETKDYRKIPVTEQVEVVSLLGDVTLGPTASRRCIHTLSSAAPMASQWTAIS